MTLPDTNIRYSRQELAIFERLHTPVWVFDIEQKSMWWANQAAVGLWGAKCLESLLARSFKEMSIVTAKRLQGYLQRFAQGEHIMEQWTFYPQGETKTVDCTCSGIVVHPENRLMMLVEGKVVAVENAVQQDTLRMIEAFRYLPTLVSLFCLDGHVLFQNPAADSVFGVNGQFSSFQQRFVISQQAEQVWSSVLHGELYTGEHEFHTLVHIEQHHINCRLIHDPVTGNVAILVNQHDITKSKQIEKELKAAEDRFELAMIGVRDGLWDHNLETGKIYYSPRWKEMLGYQDAELQGQNLWETLVHPGDFDRIRGEARAYLAQKITKFECVQRMQHKDGHYVWILTRGSAMWNSAGKATRFVGTHVDLTTQKAIEAKLQQAKEAAEIASRAKSEFMATMSHEIRTPLNGILGMAELLSKTATHPTDQRYALQIHASGKSLLTLINEILDFSKIEAGKLQLENIPFNLPDLIKEVMNLFTPSAQNKGLCMNCAISPNIPIWLRGDPIRLRQILNNLLGNAVKFTTEGKIQFKVGSLQTGEMTSTLKFEVADTGIGIDPCYHQQLFEPFSQLDSSTARRYGGSGLGLTISQRLVEMMQGQLNFNSYPSKGSTFWFSLVLPHVPSHEIPAVTQTTSQLPAPSSTVVNPCQTEASKPILLVEDDMVNQEVAKSLLELAGFTVTVARNGIEALNYCQQYSFQAILMDCQMPEMDGFTATKKIREAEHKSKRDPIPIIALTANAMQGDRERCIEVGMDDYLSKPFDSDQLREKLHDWSSRLLAYPPILLTKPKPSVLVLEPAAKPASNNMRVGQVLDERQLHQLQQQMGDNLPRLLLLYQQTVPNYLAEIDEALTAKQAALLHKAAHRLKSASKNVGTVQVVRLCEQLEELAVAETLDPGTEVLSALQAALQRAETALQQWE